MAHPYSTIDDLQQVFGGAARLKQATDWDQDRNPDTTVIANAIEAADAVIDSHLNKQRYVPLAVVPVTIRWISARMARYALAMPRGMIDEFVQRQHDQDMKWLDGVRTGEISLGVDPQPPATSMRVDAVTTRPVSKEVSRGKLRGFS